MTTSLFLSLNSTGPSRDPRGALRDWAFGITSGLLALLLLAAPLNAKAAADASVRPDSTTELTRWQTHYGKQAARLLQSDIEEKQSLALQTLVSISAGDRTVDLSSAVPALLSVYGSDPKLEHRIMAATALRNLAERSTDGDRIMQRLGDLVADQSSKRVQRVTLLMLAGYETERGRTLRVTPDLYRLLAQQEQA